MRNSVRAVSATAIGAGRLDSAHRRSLRPCLAMASSVSVAICLLVGLAPAAAHATQTVTYSWFTDLPTITGVAPVSASFEVPLSAVQTGTITQLDMSNILLSFPGIGPLSFTTGSSIGLDNAAFVDPLSGLPVFRDNNQGLAVIGYQDALFSNTFLSLTFDNVNPNTAVVADQFNAINGGPGSLGYGNGHWLATVSPIPEAGPLPMLGIGLGLLGTMAWRRRMLSQWGPLSPCI